MCCLWTFLSYYSLCCRYPGLNWSTAARAALDVSVQQAVLPWLGAFILIVYHRATVYTLKYLLFIIDYWWRLTIDYWLLIIDHWLLIKNDWLLIIDYWLLIIDYLVQPVPRTFWRWTWRTLESLATSSTSPTSSLSTSTIPSWRPAREGQPETRVFVCGLPNFFFRTVTFCYGFGIPDSYHWIRVPDPDPALFFSGFQYANKNS